MNTERFFSYVIADWDEVEVHKNAKVTSSLQAGLENRSR